MGGMPSFCRTMPLFCSFFFFFLVLGGWLGAKGCCDRTLKAKVDDVAEGELLSILRGRGKAEDVFDDGRRDASFLKGAIQILEDGVHARRHVILSRQPPASAPSPAGR